MGHRNKTKRKRVVLRLIMGLTTGFFVLSLSNALNAEGMASHKGWFRRAESVVCGDTLIDGHFKLTGNLTCTQDPAIKITGPAKLDLGGYTLSGGGR